MWCKNASKQLSALVDGELSPPQELAVRSHVEQCPRCAQELAGLQSLVRVSRGIPMEAVPAGLYTRTLTRLAYGPSTRAAVVPVRRRHAASSFWLWPGLAGAAACVVMLGLAHQPVPQHSASQSGPQASASLPKAAEPSAGTPAPAPVREDQPARAVVPTPEPRVALAPRSPEAAPQRVAETVHPASVVPSVTRVSNVIHPHRAAPRIAPADKRAVEGRGLPGPIGAAERGDEELVPDQPERDAAPPSPMMAEVPTPAPTGDESPTDTSDAVMVGMERDNGMRMAGFTPDPDTAPGDDEGVQMLRMYLSERNRSVPQPPALGPGRRRSKPL